MIVLCAVMYTLITPQNTYYDRLFVTQIEISYITIPVMINIILYIIAFFLYCVAAPSIPSKGNSSYIHKPWDSCYIDK